MPFYLSIGVSYDFFMRSNPKKLEPFVKAARMKEQRKDMDMFVLGIYVQRAVSVSIDHCLNGNKAKSEYFKEPIMKDFYDDRPQEEIDDEAIRKAIAMEDAWASQVASHLKKK